MAIKAVKDPVMAALMGRLKAVVGGMVVYK